MTQNEEDLIEMNKLMTRRGWEEEPKSRMKEQTWADIELPCNRGTVEHSEKQQLSQRWK